LFVFYFGIMADVTPPVGLASFAAAAVSGGDPIRTGFIAFFYSLRTVALPFLFIYDPTLILYGIDLGTWPGIFQASTVFVIATFAMLLFAAATQGYFLAPSRLWESAALLLVAFTLFIPSFWLDRVQAPFEQKPPTTLAQMVDQLETGERLRFVVQGPSFTTGAPTSLTISHVVGPNDPSTNRLKGDGLIMLPEQDRLFLEEPVFGSQFQEQLKNFDFYLDNRVEITEVMVAADRLPKQIFYLPAIFLFLIVIVLQRRRQTKPAF
jgi:hypothetical protein